MYNSYLKIFQTFMLLLCVYITRKVTLVYLEVIANIKIYLLKRIHCFIKEKLQVLIPKTMSASLANINTFSLIYIWMV